MIDIPINLPSRRLKQFIGALKTSSGATNDWTSASLAANRSEEEIMNGVEEYLKIGTFIDGGLQQQVESI